MATKEETAKKVAELSTLPKNRAGIRISGNRIFIDGVNGGNPIIVNDPKWETMSIAEKGEALEEIIKIVKPKRVGKAFAQGASVGTSDEAIAAATNPKAALNAAISGEGPNSQAYYDRLAQERGQLAQFRDQYPAESMIAEAGGAMTTGALAAMATGGGSTVSTGSQLARLGNMAKTGAKVGAIEGGLYGFGQGEGGLENRLKSSAIGATLGLTIGGAMGPAALGLQIGGQQVIKGAKRLFGGKGGQAVEAELQRLAQAMDMSVDEIVEGVANGSIMAENESLRMTVRALMKEGGVPETMIRKVFQESQQRMTPLGTPKDKARQAVKRKELFDEVENYLQRNNELTEKNPLVVEKEFDKAVRKAENEDYAKIKGYKKDTVPLEINRPIIEAVSDFPQIAKELEQVILSRSRGSRFFNFTKTPDGDKVVSMNRPLTLEEAELARRWFRDEGKSLQQGNAMKGRLNEYRFQIQEPLFEFSNDLAVAAGKAAQTRTAKDLFEFGQTIFNKSADEVDAMIRPHQDNPQMMKALRAGALVDFRKKTGQRGNKSFAGKLNNPEAKEAQIFDMIFTGDEREVLIPKVSQAAYSQEAANAIIQGSPTSLTDAAGKRVGADITAGEVASALSTPVNPIGGVNAMASMATKFVASINPNLSERQRRRVVEVLLSEDPELVRRALSDNRGMDALVSAITRISKGLSAGPRQGLIQQQTQDEGTLNQLAVGGAQAARGLLSGP